MADKPSRAVVVYGDGLARMVEPSHTHLHSFASHASSGFLSLPNSPSSEKEDGRIVREFAELLDASEAYANMGEESTEDKHMSFTISDRFMGMKGALVANSSHLRSLVNKIGLTMLEFNELLNDNNSAESHVLASKLLSLLGFQDGKASETTQFDIIFVRIGAEETISSLKGIEYVNNLVGALMQTAQPGSEISSRLHISVIMSYGGISKDDDVNFPLSIPICENKPGFSSVIPRQSYTVKGGKLRDNIRQYSPMLIAQWQDGVTRKDMVGAYSFNDFQKHSGNLIIPADRFVHEVAFKLWKAPKYGA